VRIVFRGCDVKVKTDLVDDRFVGTCISLLNGYLLHFIFPWKSFVHIFGRYLPVLGFVHTLGLCFVLYVTGHYFVRAGFGKSMLLQNSYAEFKALGYFQEV